MFSTRRFVDGPLACRPRLLFITDPTGTGGGSNDPTPPADDADADKWKAHSRTWEARAKAKPDITKEELAELREKAAKVDQADEDKKSEIDKLTERLGKAEQALAEREAKDAETAKKSELATIAAEVAKAKGVPADALRGGTREELEVHADQLASILPKTPAAPGTGGQGEGEPIGDGDMSAVDVVKAARGH
ncbi:hypothetical protein [Homoserinibacter sp. GY 40078]|uniref:hypothetical protein n=1 Tax=Homoserinibacter sp. GY 40078 TaxID=2603275 RepID=UPI0011CACA30|nr:hypothetical protein [Homoserinibacter sp. GY 40078]TXK17400.1 hypothetical protein FVQ89_11235 [Homoserinibacter sp. GY 40078]